MLRNDPRYFDRAAYRIAVLDELEADLKTATEMEALGQHLRGAHRPSMKATGRPSLQLLGEYSSLSSLEDEILEKLELLGKTLEKYRQDWLKQGEPDGQ